MAHDQNFKNLILDYPRHALAFFAAEEARNIATDARVIPIRQEQLQERLGERFRELDIPLLVEWPDGRRAALLFVLEEETEARRFSIHRLAHYCLDLAELFATERVVPVVIFLRAGSVPRQLALGGEHHTYLSFHYLACELSAIPFEHYRDSDNLVARLNLPNMKYAPAQRVEVYAQAVRGLARLEPDPEKQLKYLDFIDIYAGLDDNERQRYQSEYTDEANLMSTFAERFRTEGRSLGIEQGIEQGMRQGVQQGRQSGEAAVLLRLLERKFSAVPEPVRQRIANADEQRLLDWSERVLTATTLEEVFR
ncbi:MAG: hypothetical protein WCA32_08070 [Chromatiaceae bacterium]